MLVVPAEAIDEAAAGAFLREYLGRAVADVEWVGEGAWSRCFGFVDHGREFVVRFGAYIDDFENDRRAGAWGSPVLPIPQVSAIGAALGGYFAISTRARGVPLESLDRDGWQAVLPSLLDALDALREIDLSGTHGFGGWGRDGSAPHKSWRDFLLAVEVDTSERRIHGWRQRLIDSPIGDASFRAGWKRLAEITEAMPCERHVVHSDLINRNVLVSDGRVAGVFDWGCSLYGDFLYDVAWLLFWSPWFDAMASCDLRGAVLRHYDASGVEVPDFDDRLRACMIHIGLDHQAYTAHTGSLQDLIDVTDRLLPLLD